MCEWNPRPQSGLLAFCFLPALPPSDAHKVVTDRAEAVKFTDVDAVLSWILILEVDPATRLEVLEAEEWRLSRSFSGEAWFRSRMSEKQVHGGDLLSGFLESDLGRR